MANVISIWQPRWHDNKVLIACHKVGKKNRIVFTKAPTLEGVYLVDGAEVEKCKKESNGRIMCYAVPLELLKKEEAVAEPKSYCCGALIRDNACLNCGQPQK